MAEYIIVDGGASIATFIYLEKKKNILVLLCPYYAICNWPVEITEKRYCTIPESTDGFVLQSYGSMHGVDKTPGDDNRLLAFIIGWIDPIKHQKIINRSKEVYKDYVHYA